MQTRNTVSGVVLRDDGSNTAVQRPKRVKYYVVFQLQKHNQIMVRLRYFSLKFSCDLEVMEMRRDIKRYQYELGT